MQCGFIHTAEGNLFANILLLGQFTMDATPPPRKALYVGWIACASAIVPKAPINVLTLPEGSFDIFGPGRLIVKI